MASSNTMNSDAPHKRRELFGDCALVEIIHLHDCLRGAIRALQQDVQELSQSIDKEKRKEEHDLLGIERRVAGRFKVIWSVFRAHSAAEDEFIWPALQRKMSNNSAVVEESDVAHNPREVAASHKSETDQAPVVHPIPVNASPSVVIEKEEYEEDHADEEQMFKTMDGLLSKLRQSLIQEKEGILSAAQTAQKPSNDSNSSSHDTAKAIHELTKSLSQHLMDHLAKEETQCMPLVVKLLTKTEIHDLVGQIMGQRSSDTIAQIMTMAVQNLNETDRDEMVEYMKEAMLGTYFEKWLSMSGWMMTKKEDAASSCEIQRAGKREDSTTGESLKKRAPDSEGMAQLQPPTEKKPRPSESSNEASKEHCPLGNSPSDCAACGFAGRCNAADVAPVAQGSQTAPHAAEITTSQTELEKFIRVIASNPELSSVQKTTTIQSLRDSVWKSNQRHTISGDGIAAQSATASAPPVLQMTLEGGASHIARHAVHSASVATTTRSRRMTPASSYYKKDREGNVILIWSSDAVDPSKFPPDKSLPLFSAAELAPTYHDGANGAVLGCPHYARACKLRHPSSGRLYTCRLCCEQEREMPMKDHDAPLDRYAVTEVLCMRCGALQPANDRCVNTRCESRGKPFAKYSCKICNLYDDGPSKTAYHCPFCNVCRTGRGLGIDYRHCMRCNACVSLADDDHHCIPQRLQGTCPICHESMFESTEPLRGLKCGHVMHLSCFSMYIRGHSYTCPLCKKSVEDMQEYFSLLDNSIRMQPMPSAYLSTVSDIYCQDCSKSGRVQYHFVGCKCPHCGSYNTRELGRVQNSHNSTPPP